MKRKYKAIIVICTTILMSNLLFNVNGLSFLENTEDGSTKIRQVLSTADFAINYPDYENIIADSELIVYGTTLKTESFLDDYGLQVYSRIQFEVENVLKG